MGGSDLPIQGRRMAMEVASVGRYQVNLTVDEQLKEAILFAAARDGLTASSKIRQILTQQLTRTIDSADFKEHQLARAARQLRAGGGNDGGQ